MTAIAVVAIDSDDLCAAVALTAADGTPPPQAIDRVIVAHGAYIVDGPERLCRRCRAAYDAAVVDAMLEGGPPGIIVIGEECRGAFPRERME